MSSISARYLIPPALLLASLLASNPASAESFEFDGLGLRGGSVREEVRPDGRTWRILEGPVRLSHGKSGLEASADWAAFDREQKIVEAFAFKGRIPEISANFNRYADAPFDAPNVLYSAEKFRFENGDFHLSGVSVSLNEDPESLLNVSVKQFSYLDPGTTHWMIRADHIHYGIGEHRLIWWPSYRLATNPPPNKPFWEYHSEYYDGDGVELDLRMQYPLTWHWIAEGRFDPWSEGEVFHRGSLYYRNPRTLMRFSAGRKRARTRFINIGELYLPVRENWQAHITHELPPLLNRKLYVRLKGELGDYREDGYQIYREDDQLYRAERKVEGQRALAEVDISTRWFNLFDGWKWRIGGDWVRGFYDDVEAFTPIRSGRDPSTLTDYREFGGYVDLDWRSEDWHFFTRFFRNNVWGESPFIYDNFEDRKELWGRVDFPLDRRWAFSVFTRYQFLADSRLVDYRGATDGRFEDMDFILTRRLKDFDVSVDYDYVSKNFNIFFGVVSEPWVD
jgi:hypothetical protein